MLARPCGIRDTRSLGERVSVIQTPAIRDVLCVCVCCYCTGALHLALAIDGGSKGGNGCVSL
jgi:hypothetical protein